MARCQKDLAATLGKRFAGRVMHVPVTVTKRDVRTAETTQRTRSFLFAAIGSVLAGMCGRKRLSFYENGTLSFNLPIAAQVVGARATRSTHPRALQFMADMLQGIVGHGLEIENPFVWKTKTEVVDLLVRSGQSNLIDMSISCSHVHEMSTLWTHCGRCSQCLDRRFATLAAGAEILDSPEKYAIDLLTGLREDGEDRALAESFVRHARDLAHISDAGFFSRFAGHVARAFPGFPTRSRDEVAREVANLHRRHGRSVLAVLEQGYRLHAHELAAGALPEDCLLRMTAAGAHVEDRLVEEPDHDQPEEETVRDVRDFSVTSELRLALSPKRRRILIEGIPDITAPASYALVGVLVAANEMDRQASLAPENHRYVPADELADAFGIEETTLRRRVLRIRRDICRRFETFCGLTLGGDCVIENRPRSGYRLNPAVRVVAEDQIARTGEGHGARPKGSRMGATDTKNQGVGAAG